LKIAIIGSRGYPYVYSGYETFVRELSERLVKQGVEVTVYCHKQLFSERPKQVNGIHLAYIPSIETKILSQLSHSFLSFLHASYRRYDVILAVNSANGPFGLITRLFKVKTAINVDGLEWLRPKWKGLGAKYFYWASKQATRFFDILINDSDEMRKVYLDLFDRDSKVIAYGANIRYSQNADLINHWAIIPDSYYLIVGRMVPDNNADVLLKGFMKTSSTKKLVIVGDVPYSDQWASQLKQLGVQDDRLIFTGYVTDQNVLAELYHNCYAYLHGHEFGGTNPTMLKAMAYGCAILALDTPFNREMLQDGKHGAFFTKEELSFSHLIDKIDQHPEEVSALKSCAREGITNKYNWDNVTQSYLEVFEELVHSASR
jgi:glycosyltransferase involved in cell wall biosynthesis